MRLCHNASLSFVPVPEGVADANQPKGHAAVGATIFGLLPAYPLAAAALFMVTLSERLYHI